MIKWWKKKSESVSFSSFVPPDPGCMLVLSGTKGTPNTAPDAVTTELHCGDGVKWGIEKS